MRRFDPHYHGKEFAIKGRRLSGGHWTWLRRKYLRANPFCEDCGRPGEEVHHIIARAQRPDLMHDYSNLRTLCKACHARTHGLKKPRF